MTSAAWIATLLFVGHIYARGTKLQIRYKDVGDRWIQKSSGLNVGEEEKAAQVLEVIEQRIAAERAEITARGGKRPAKPSRALTVEAYFDRWTIKRKHIRTSGDEATRLRNHALPIVDKVAIRELKAKHVRELVDHLRSKDLAPRTQLHVYQSLKTMLNRAVRDEVITTNPCNLEKSELPKKRDKDLAWRSQAVFTREEIIQLITDARVPVVRRMFYATVFLTGARFGEVAALLWSDLTKREPLKRLLSSKSYDTKSMTIGDPKTEVAREVPVHRNQCTDGPQRFRVA